MPRVTALLASKRATHATVNKQKVSSTHTLWPECVSTSLALCCACTTDLIHSLAAYALYKLRHCTHTKDMSSTRCVRDLIWFGKHITQVPTAVPAPPIPFTLVQRVRRAMRRQLHAGHHLRLACFVAQPCNGSRSILASLLKPSVKHSTGRVACQLGLRRRMPCNRRDQLKSLPASAAPYGYTHCTSSVQAHTHTHTHTHTT
jgi:hypothetical protein